ncbi:MAG: YqiA/YcfP family alpha/beta fold hydrolase [Elainellaceae cyanobacterium]
MAIASGQSTSFLRCIYLHGFASGPLSYKAEYLEAKFAEFGQTLVVPDLNLGGFYNLTLTRQIEQVSALVRQSAEPTVLIGSSFGGLTAAWVAEHCHEVSRLVLLAPAFSFLRYLKLGLGAQQSQWQQDGEISLYHYGFRQEKMLSYGFVVDLARYRDEELRRSLPTLIIHGRRDDVIPLSASQCYGNSRPWVSADWVDDDHTLAQSIPYIWHCLKEQIDPHIKE